MSERKKHYPRYPKLDDFHVTLLVDLVESLKSFGVADPELMPQAVVFVLIAHAEPEAQALSSQLFDFLMTNNLWSSA